MIKKQVKIINIALLLVLLVLQLTSGMQDNNEDGQDKDDVFDFIIIGSATATPVLARRISSNRRWRVLVLDSGSMGLPENNIPLNVNRLPRDCQNAYGFMYERNDDNCQAMNGQQCPVNVIKGLGGDTMLGDMVYNRGNQKDYDSLCKTNPGWCFKDVLPFFKKLENNTIPGDKIEFCGRDGPITISYPNYLTELADKFVEAGKEMGYSAVNFNGRQQTGFAKVQLMMKNGLRQNTYDAYLAPKIANRPNLIIRTNVQVTKLLFGKNREKRYSSESDLRVTGVEYKYLGFRYVVSAEREVILSTNDVHNAQILMLSGVGPADHLKSNDIKVVKNLPVGYNYHEIVGVGGLVFLSNVKVPNLQETFTKNNLLEFLKTREGSAGSAVTEAIAFLESSPKFREYPNYQLTLRTGSIVSMPIRRSIYNLDEKIFDEHYNEILTQAGTSFEIIPSVSRPKSRGRVMLQSKNPDDLPIVKGNFYSDPYDLKCAVKAIKTTLKLVKTEAFKSINARFHDKPFSPCAKHDYSRHNEDDNDDEYWKCYVNHFTFPLDRRAGTTKMGSKDDKTTVVDNKLRVHGIKNLRVIGSSVWPQQVTGHATSAKIMLAEKASDVICKYHNFLDETDHESFEDSDEKAGFRSIVGRSVVDLLSKRVKNPLKNARY